MRSDFPNLADRIHCVIASIANEFRVNQTMELYNPEIVFHAAAHKHVPLMELNEQEAVHNNVIGTTNVAEAAGGMALSVWCSSPLTRRLIPPALWALRSGFANNRQE